MIWVSAWYNVDYIFPRLLHINLYLTIDKARKIRAKSNFIYI